MLKTRLLPARRISLLALAAALSLAAGTARASDDPFGKVVKHIEEHYQAKKTKIPMMGLVNFVFKFWHPAGVKNVKLAVFEHQNLIAGRGTDDFDTVIRQAAGSAWQPLVRVYSRPKGEWTYIYVSSGKDMKVLVASLEKNESVVAEVKFEPRKLIEFLEKPKIMGMSLAHDLKQGPAGPDQSHAARARETEQTAALAQADGETLGGAGQSSDSPAKGRPVLIRATDGVEGAEAVSGARPSPAGGPVAATDVDKRDPDVIKLEARLVNLNVKATDNSGRVRAGLTKGDFLVLQDGVKQQLAFFEPNTSPVSLVLLLDLSGSTKDKMHVMRKAASRFLDSLGPGDTVAVAAFTRRFTVVAPFTADRRLLKHRVEKIRNHQGGTAYYDAMWSALDLIGEVAGGRKAIVVLTDGVDNSISNPKMWPTKHKFEDLLGRAAEEDATIYPIYLDTEAEEVARRGEKERPVYETARSQLESIAEMTAGTVFKAKRDEDLSGVYQRVAAELHTLYTLAYVPTTSPVKGKWRTIDIKVDQPGVVAKTRRGYFDR